jgi:hypothetical protein
VKKNPTKQMSTARKLSVDPLIVLISFGVGIFIVYMTQRTPEVIIKLPTPHSEDAKTLFRDDVDNCYSFKIENVTCTQDAIDFPIERRLELFDLDGHGMA